MRAGRGGSKLAQVVAGTDPGEESRVNQERRDCRELAEDVRNRQRLPDGERVVRHEMRENPNARNQDDALLELEKNRYYGGNQA